MLSISTVSVFSQVSLVQLSCPIDALSFLIDEVQPTLPKGAFWLRAFPDHACNLGAHDHARLYANALRHACGRLASQRQLGFDTGFRYVLTLLGTGSRHVAADWVKAFIYPFTMYNTLIRVLAGIDAGIFR
jgi:hypothetical protein